MIKKRSYNNYPTRNREMRFFVAVLSHEYITMDFTKYINSKDIREYHRKINYEYNSLEAAWLVWQCNDISLREKHDAWRWIINNMPDQSLIEDINMHDHGDKSLHETLDAYISFQNRFIDEFTRNENDRLYTYEYRFIDWRGFYASEPYKAVYTSWDSCIRAIEQKADDIGIRSALIFRSTAGEDKEYDRNGNGFVEINLDSEIWDVGIIMEEPEGFTDLTCFFEDQRFEFPVPFKEGDIVCWNTDNWREIKPMVLTGIVSPPWQNSDKCKKKRERDGGYISDMNFWGYHMYDTEGIALADHGKRFRTTGVDEDIWWDYMDLEYYHGELEGIDRCLKPISAFIKKEIHLDVLLNAYHHIMTEEYCKHTMPFQYTQECMIDAGLCTF